MKAEFKRDMYKSYMIFEENKELERSYELKMISGNSIVELLKLEVKILDGERKYYYDITTLKALSQVFQKVKIKKEQMVMIMESILDTMERVREFLLKEDNLILDPEFIFMNLSEQEIHLAYLPGYDRTASQQFENLLEFLMDRTDYAQEEAVKLSYALYKINRGKNYSVQEFKEVLSGKVNPYEGERLHIRREEVEEEPEDIILEERIVMEKRKVIEDMKKGTKWMPYIYCITVIVAAFITIWLTAKTGFLFNPINGQLEINKMVLFLVAIGGGVAFLLCIIFGMGQHKIGTTKEEQIKEEIKEKQIKEEGIKKERTKEERIKEERIKKERIKKEGTKEERTKEERIKKEQIKEEQRKGIENAKLGEYTKEQEEKSYIMEDMYEDRTTILTKEMADYNASKYYLASLNKEVYQDIYLLEFPFFIGKLKTNVDYVIKSQAVSRFHAKIEKGESGFFIVDLNSTNGTFVNGERLLLNEKREVYLGDEVTFANVVYNFIKL